METINEKVVTEKAGLNMESIPDMKDNMEKDLEPSESPSEEVKSERPDIMITEEMMNDEIARLENLNFIEVLQFRRDHENQKKNLSAAKEAVEQLLKAQKQIEVMQEEGNKLGAEIAAADAENKADLNNEDIDSFLENYDISIERITKTIEAADEKLKEFDDIPKTATYMNKAMLEIAEKNLARIADLESKGNANLKVQKRYYTEQQKIYSERDSVEFILSKIPEKKIFVRRWIESVKKEAKQNKKSNRIILSTQNSVTKAFCSIFSVNQMLAFENYLKKILVGENQDDTSVFLTQYMLYIIYIDEKVRTRGQGKWIETFIMNVLDIINNNYDLPNGIDYWNDQLKKVRDSVMEGLPKIKV